MSSVKPPTILEKVTGDVVTESAFTLIAALSGNPLAVLLPVLNNALASGRMRRRVEAALLDIDTRLRLHEDKLSDLSDSQYKLLNETILAVLQSTDSEKLEYLRQAVDNCLSMSDLQLQESVVLSRVIRDISAEEVRFCIQNSSFDYVQLISSTPSDVQSVLAVDPEDRLALIVTGLMALGLLMPAEATWDGSGRLKFSSVVARLITLVQVNSA